MKNFSGSILSALDTEEECSDQRAGVAASSWELKHLDMVKTMNLVLASNPRSISIGGVHRADKNDNLHVEIQKYVKSHFNYLRSHSMSTKRSSSQAVSTLNSEDVTYHMYSPSGYEVSQEEARRLRSLLSDHNTIVQKLVAITDITRLITPQFCRDRVKRNKKVMQSVGIDVCLLDSILAGIDSSTTMGSALAITGQHAMDAFRERAEK